MRTTLDIADDVLLAAKEMARRQQSSAGAVISDLARKGLLAGEQVRRAKAASPSPLQAVGIHPLPKRGGIVTNELIDRLRDDGPY